MMRAETLHMPQSGLPEKNARVNIITVATQPFTEGEESRDRAEER